MTRTAVNVNSKIKHNENLFTKCLKVRKRDRKLVSIARISAEEADITTRRNVAILVSAAWPIPIIPKDFPRHGQGCEIGDTAR
jgi:hypothetical protein